MRDRDYEPIPPTLAQLAADPHCTGIFCWCNKCSHNTVLPLAPVVAQLGPDCPFPSLHGRFRCQACGSKDIHARPDWWTPGVVTRHHPSWYRKEPASAGERKPEDVEKSTVPT